MIVQVFLNIVNLYSFSIENYVNDFVSEPQTIKCHDNICVVLLQIPIANISIDISIKK